MKSVMCIVCTTCRQTEQPINRLTQNSSHKYSENVWSSHCLCSINLNMALPSNQNRFEKMYPKAGKYFTSENAIIYFERAFEILVKLSGLYSNTI